MDTVDANLIFRPSTIMQASQLNRLTHFEEANLYPDPIPSKALLARDGQALMARDGQFLIYRP